MLARLLRAAPLRLHSVRYCSSNNDGMLAAVIDRDRTVANVVNPYTGHSEPLYKPDPLTPFEKKWKWLLTAMRVYGTKGRLLRNSEALFRSAEEQATQNGFYDALSLPHDFATEHNLIALHVWILHNRFRLDYDGRGVYCGRRVQEEVFERFWEDCVLKTRNVGVPEMSVSKQLVNLQRVAFNAMMSYDDGIAETGDDNMKLSGALWRSVFRGDPAVDPKNVLLLADYTRREVENLLTIPKEDFFAGWIPWGPGVGETVEDRLERQRALFTGEWREAVHNDGRMYFFHTTKRQSQWEIPEEGLYTRRRYALLKHFERLELEGMLLPAYVKDTRVKLSPPRVPTDKSTTK